MSFIPGLGYFVSWGSYNGQTCFPLLDADNCSCPRRQAHMTRKKGDCMCNLCCLCHEYRVFEYRPLSGPDLFLRMKALKHSKEYFVSGGLKKDRVSFFHTLDLENKTSSGGFVPLTPTGGGAPVSHTGFLRPPDPLLSGFLTFLHSHLCLLITLIFSEKHT